MSTIRFELATETDDAALRRILRTSPIPGAISLTFEREPSFRAAAAVEGPFHQTVVAREMETGEIVGMGSRSVRDRWVNGRVRPVGYLSQIRFSPKFKQGLYLARGLAGGMKFFRELHDDGRTSFYLSSIIADNEAARRLFQSGRAGMPRFHEYARMFTYAVYTGRSKSAPELPRGLGFSHGTREHAKAIADCLERNGARRQFAPYWNEETLFSPDCTPGLRPADLVLAIDGERVVGCIGCWDQSQVKQTVVRGYSNRLGRWRKLINLAAPLGGWPRLPPPGSVLRHAYASPWAVDDDHIGVCSALFRAVYNHAVARGYDYIMLGMSEADPLRAAAIKGYPHITYQSELFLAAWEDGEPDLRLIDSRVPGVDIALL